MLNYTYMLFALSGPSGVGKSTLQAFLMETFGFRKVVTCTSRPPRMQEVQGKDYYFISEAKFKEHLNNDYYISQPKMPKI